MKKTLLLAFILLATLMVHADYQSSGSSTATAVICASPCIDISGETNLAAEKGVALTGDTLSTAFVGVSAGYSASTEITDNTWTAIPFVAENFDTNTFHDNSSNTTRFTVPDGYSGKYLITAEGDASVTGNTNGLLGIGVFKNGTVAAVPGLFHFSEWPANSTTSYHYSVAGIISLSDNAGAANDYVELYMSMDGATASYFVTGAIMLHFLGP